MRPVLSLVAAVIVGCNGIAGLSDLHNGTLVTTDASIDAATGDASSGSNDASSDTGASSDGATSTDADTTDATADAITDLDADVPPTCTGSDVGLRITVAPSTQYASVRDQTNNITVDVGTSFTGCFASGTLIQLSASPDNSNATHDWGGVCSAGRRCQFNLTTPTVVDVTL